MSSNDTALNHAIEQATSVLQPMFVRPKLRSRLMKKPPFRFLHDIIFSIIKSTNHNFPSSLLFTDAELDSSTFKNDKEAKIQFLDKIIAFVNASREVPIEVESKHIVAGVKAAATLNLLVAFGELATQDDIGHASIIQSVMRTEIVEEDTKVDGVSEETRGGFAESKVSEEDVIVEDTKDEDNANFTGEVYNNDCSMAHCIDRIIQSASIIESLYTE